MAEVTAPDAPCYAQPCPTLGRHDQPNRMCRGKEKTLRTVTGEAAFPDLVRQPMQGRAGAAGTAENQKKGVTQAGGARFPKGAASNIQGPKCKIRLASGRWFQQLEGN